jgi:ribose transport system substrate-binding protein
MLIKKTFNRRTFLKFSAIVGASIGTPLYSFLEWRLANADTRPINSAISSAGLASSWNAQGKAATDKFAQFLGVNVSWFDGEHDDQKHLAIFEQIAMQRYDFVAVQPNGIGILTAPITTIAKTTPVIDMDTLIAPLDQLRSMGVLTLISCDNVTLSEAVVTSIVEKMGGRGQIARTGGQQGHTGAQGRHQGFLNVLKNYPDITVVDDEPGDWDTTKTAQIWQTLLTRYPNISGCFCDNDDMALAAQKVIADAGKDQQVFVGGIDGMTPAIQAIVDGKMVATARNSATRVHAWAMVAGAYAATVGLEQARKELPFFVLADGPVILSDVDINDAFKDTPWKLKAYGLSTAPGQVWIENQLFF